MRHRRTLFGLVFLTLALGSANACSNQAEGQRCDKLSGNADCESGLVCVTFQQGAPTTTVTTKADGGTVKKAVPATYTPAVCCPPAGVSATTAACQAVGMGTSAPPPTEGDGGSAGDGGAAGASGSAGDGGSAGAGGTGGGGGRDASATGGADAGSGFAGTDAGAEAGR